MTNTEDFVFKLQEICAQLNYLIAFKSDDNGNVTGFIIGNVEFLEDVMADLPDAEDYEIWQLDPKIGKEIH